MRRYASIADGLVTNIITGRPAEDESRFPYIKENLPVCVGDAYADGTFFRNGRELHTQLEDADAEITTLAKAGVEHVQAYCNETGNPPKENSGIFVRGVPEWEAGKTYKQFELFSYNGEMGFAKQVHTSQETWLPFTVGTEALYGARPVPSADGIYPYIYNMAASIGMLVRDPDDGLVYECIQSISDMLYKPSQIPAHFVVK